MATDTIVLVHGFWVTPRSWEHWITHWSDLVTEVAQFDGPHVLPAQDGWEEVADHALGWTVEDARLSSPA